MLTLLEHRRREEWSVAMDSLATDLVLSGARLAIRIEPGEPIVPALSALQGDVLSICARLADGEAIDPNEPLSSSAGASSLELGQGAGPCELFGLASALAHLDDALNRGAPPSGGCRQDEGFRYLQRDTSSRVFHRNFWLYALSDQRRDLFERLQSEGIASDDDWLRREESFEADLRLEVEKHRFDFARRAAGIRQVVPDVLLSRLCALLPRWLSMNHPLVMEQLPELQKLRAAGIDSFETLSRTSPSALEAALGPDGISRRDLARAIGQSLPRLFDDLIWEGIAGVSAAEAADVHPGKFSSFKALVAWLLARLGHGRPREKHSLDDIRTRQRTLAARIGESSIAGFGSLQAITASVFGPSSQGGERARQVQQKGVMELRNDKVVAGLLAALQEQIDDAIEHAGGQLPMGVDCPVRALATSEPMAAARFLKLFFREGRLGRYRLTDDGLFLVRFDWSGEEDADQRLLSIVRACSQPDERRWRSIMPRLEALADEYPPSTRETLEREFFDSLNWSKPPPDPDALLVSRGKTAAAVVVAMLSRQNRAMSRAELAAACKDSEFDLKLKPANLGNVLSALTADPHNASNPDIFEPVFQLGHGIYACQAAMPLAMEQTGPLAERTAELICKERRSIREHPAYGDLFQWHCSDLVECLQQKGEGAELEVVDEGQRWYLLDAILRYHRPEGIVNLQKGYWMAQVTDLHPDHHEKVDQNEVVEWVLETFAGDGQAMPIAEVREQVARVQSLGATGQLQAANKIPDGRRMEKAGRGLLRLKS